MTEFIICRNILIEEYAHVQGESLAEVEAKWHTGILDPSFELGDTQQTGDVLIYAVPQDPNALHPSTPDLREVAYLKEQAQTLREALKQAWSFIEDVPEDAPDRPEGFFALRSTVRKAFHSTEEPRP